MLSHLMANIGHISKFSKFTINTVDQKLKSDKFQNMSMGPDILANLLLTMPFSSKLEQQLQVYVEKKSLSYLNFILPVVLYQEI